MNADKHSMTALISSFARAYHFENDTPKIFSDTIARQLMTDEEYAQRSEYIADGIDFFAPERKDELNEPQKVLQWLVQTQLAPTPLARAKYCEDMLENAVRNGAEQYVILGAGMDTFAYRNKKVLSHINVFEVDHPSTQAFKKIKVLEAGWTVPNNVHYAAIDLTKDNVADGLKNAGFDANKQTFFSWLGVSYYLTKQQITNTLQSISAISHQGNSIVFDYADENLFSSNVKRVQNMIAMANASGEPMQSCFSYEELKKLLENVGLIVSEHLTPEHIEARFFTGRTDYLHAFEHINYVLANKK